MLAAQQKTEPTPKPQTNKSQYLTLIVFVPVVEHSRGSCTPFQHHLYLEYRTESSYPRYPNSIHIPSMACPPDTRRNTARNPDVISSIAE